VRRALTAMLLCLAAAAAHGQSVTFSACNPSSVEIDVYFAQGAKVSTAHVRPTECARVAGSDGAMSPGVVGVGFADEQGQWGGVHRMENVPNFGSLYVDRTTQTIPVSNGGVRTLPAQFLFKPPSPLCKTDILVKEIPGGGTVVEEYTTCDDFKYALNVLAFPDTREVAFLDFCESCLEKQRKATGGPIPMSVSESSHLYRENQEWNPTYWDRIGWADVPRYAREVFTNPDMIGSAAVLQGTISAVGSPASDPEAPWVNVYFREAPNREFILCVKSPDILADAFGAAYASAMVGKTVEVEGLVARCLDGAGILVKLQHQIKVVGTGPGMVAAVNPPAFNFPRDTSRSEALPLVTVRQYDRFAPNWDINAEAQIQNFCTSMYSPGFFLPEPFATAKFTHPTEIAAEIRDCQAKFNAEELRANRQATLHYCLTHFDYTAPNARVESYNQCFTQNDGLLVMCTQVARYHGALAGGDPNVQCPPVAPLPSEIVRVKKGGKFEGPDLPVPVSAPGMPPSLMQALASLVPGVIRSAGPLPGQVNLGGPATPTPAIPTQAAPAPTQAPQAQPARASDPLETARRQQACVEKAVKDNPNGGSAQMNAILACTQLK
jgi:hypothetical protein